MYLDISSVHKPESVLHIHNTIQLFVQPTSEGNKSLDIVLTDQTILK